MPSVALTTQQFLISQITCVELPRIRQQGGAEIAICNPGRLIDVVKSGPHRHRNRRDMTGPQHHRRRRLSVPDWINLVWATFGTTHFAKIRHWTRTQLISKCNTWTHGHAWPTNAMHPSLTGWKAATCSVVHTLRGAQDVPGHTAVQSNYIQLSSQQQREHWCYIVTHT